jgi:hypothetical protein
VGSVISRDNIPHRAAWIADAVEGQEVMGRFGYEENEW